MKFKQNHNDWFQMADKNHGGIIDNDKTQMKPSNAKTQFFFGDQNFFLF